MILHALILGTAAALSGFLMNALESRPGVELLYWGFPFGAVLAAYLWIVLSVRSFAKVLLVSLMAEAAFYFATLGSMFVGLIAGPRHYKAQTELNMMSLVAGTIAGGLVSLGFLAALHGPGKIRASIRRCCCARRECYFARPLVVREPGRPVQRPPARGTLHLADTCNEFFNRTGIVPQQQSGVRRLWAFVRALRSTVDRASACLNRGSRVRVAAARF